MQITCLDFHITLFRASLQKKYRMRSLQENISPCSKPNNELFTRTYSCKVVNITHRPKGLSDSLILRERIPLTMPGGNKIEGYLVSHFGG